MLRIFLLDLLAIRISLVTTFVTKISYQKNQCKVVLKNRPQGTLHLKRGAALLNPVRGPLCGIQQGEQAKFKAATYLGRLHLTLEKDAALEVQVMRELTMRS